MTLRAALLLAMSILAVHADDAWLRYAPLDDVAAREYRDVLPAAVTVLGHSALLDSAQAELLRGVRGMLGRTLRLEPQLPSEPAIILGSLADVRRVLPDLRLASEPPDDGYWLHSMPCKGGRCIVIAGRNDRGVLYGTFALLRRMALNGPIADLDEVHAPYAPIRWIDQWDNLDGSIERGYGGRSIFWDGGHVRADLARAADYARLLASLGIDACSVNNVNADPRLLTNAYIPELARIAEAFRPWGVRLVLSVDFASPKSIGGLDTFDPIDPSVASWWQSRADDLYRAIPDLAGFVMKADSEGRAGPSAYKRTHADAANVVARALKPHAGLLFYRAFVYNHHMDWRDPNNDRARAAYDNFHPLDGRFDDNVVLQIKNGPIDFQVREPVSPLLGALEKTNEALELQITQEYMGQARHTVFLGPQWKEVLDFDLHAHGPGTPVKALVAGRVFHRPTGGFVGVANVGLDDNWLGNDLSLANLYAFGRLAWSPDLSAARIAEEWTKLSFGSERRVVDTIDRIQLTSWRAYENYTGPLGLQTLTDITGNHYGPAVEASERNGWGQWHRADEHGVGMDRSMATGTGFTGQYSAPVASMYESLATCPDDLLLFFHHVPYTYVLHSGKTVIQSIYDSHYEGAATVAEYVRSWKALHGLIDDERYQRVLKQLQYQAGAAELWRDAVDRWFLRESGIPDAHGRVGHHPERTEAESMRLDGYSIIDVTPWETASGGRAASCAGAACAAAFRFQRAPGWYTIEVRYFDQNNGGARFRLFIGAQLIDEWTADAHLPSAKIDGTTSTRRMIAGIGLRPGDIIRIEGRPDNGDQAAIDYVEIEPQR